MKWTISKKMYGAFGTVGVLMMSFALYVAHEMSSFVEGVNEIQASSTEVRLVKEMQLRIANLWQFMTDASLTKDREVIESEAKPNMTMALAAIDTLIILNKGETRHLKVFESFKSDVPKIFAVGMKMFEAYGKGQREGDMAMDEYDKACDKVIQEGARVAEDIEKLAFAKVAEVNARAMRSVTIALTLTALAFAGIMAIAIVSARQIAKPVQEVVEQMDNADLNTHLEANRTDEIGDLIRAFDKFVSTIRRSLLQVRDVSFAVSSSSSEISCSTEQMAKGAREQTTQASEVASAVEEMAKTIVENSSNAKETAAVAHNAKAAAEQGGDVVRRTIAAMKEIEHVVRNSATTVHELGKSSNEIGRIISVIDDIADQTNLLALNAAIEAARAGEQGRGFAVVADEVRKLSERTTKATKEIADMIEQIQHDTSGAVQSMEEGTKKVGDGIHLADEAGKSLDGIVTISQRVTEMVTQIAAASEQQSSASEQISHNVEAINNVTNESAAGTEQIAHAADDLNSLTQQLQDAIGKFRLAEDVREPIFKPTRVSRRKTMREEETEVLTQ